MSIELTTALAALTGTTTIGGDVEIGGKINPNDATHLFWWFGDETEAITLVADVWEQFTNGTSDLFTLAESDGITSAADQFTIVTAGDYDLHAKTTMEGANGVVFALRFYNVTQAAAIPTAGGATARGAGNKITCISSAYAEGLAVGDVMQLQIMSDANGDGTYNAGTVKADLIHL